MSEKPAFNIHNPPHLVANELIRAIEGYLWQDGVGVKFGEIGHAMIEKFVDLYNREIERYYDKSNQYDIESQRLYDAIVAARQALSNYTHGGAQYMPDILEADSILAEALKLKK